MLKRSHKFVLLWVLSFLPVIVLFQNCSSYNMFGLSAQGGNDQGYGGKVYAQVGVCSDNVVRIKNQIVIPTDATSGRMTVENCAPADRIVTGFRILATQNALAFENAVYVQLTSLQEPPQTIQNRTLQTFIRMQFLSSAQREPGAQELENFTNQYDPGASRGCVWIGSTLIRGQESMTIQEAMATADRSAYIIRALLDRAGTSAEIAQWTENAPSYTWQMIYDDILATPDYANRCASFGLGL